MKQIRLVILFLLASLTAVSCSRENPILKIERNYLSQEATAAGLSVKIPVRANGTFTASVPSDAASWCHTETMGVFVNLTVDPLDGGGNRETSVTVSSAGCHDIIITVKQASVIVIDAPAQIVLSASLKSFSLRINSGVNLEFSYPDWIHPVDAEWVSGEKTYTFEASDYSDPDSDKRSGKFVISAPKAGFNLEIPVSQIAYLNSAVKTLMDLWKTDIFASSPLDKKSSRYSLLMDIESMCDALSRDEFHSYLSMADAAAAKEEETKDILALYKAAFDHVLSQVQSTKVENGSVVIWMLYNAGFVVKTPSATFGLDINHRYAVSLAPYLDFICVSHSDSDHIDNALMAAMDRAGKPVLSNFHTANQYCSTVPTTYTIGDIKIKTSITDENETDLHCTTIHRIKCGSDTGGFEIIHTGDSSYDRTQFTECLDGSATNVLILRYGGGAEKNILGTLSGQVVPEYVILSHVEELRHYPNKSPKRAWISQAVDNMKGTFGSTSAAGKCYLPFWGEKMVWKNGKLQ